MKNLNILLIEDNEGDIVLITEAMNELKANYKLNVARDGELALQFLEKKDIYINEPAPHLVLLDLNLPKIDGKSVLRAIKSNSTLKKIPVIVLTTSSADSDILDAYELQANSYIVKPTEYQHFLDVISVLGNYWINIVQLPNYNRYDV
jgi:CheY-like chemotaxis protein